MDQTGIILADTFALGVTPQIIEYPFPKYGFANRGFVFPNDNKAYMITDETFCSRGINKMNPLLKDDEIMGPKVGEETIFTYIIGTEMVLTEDRMLLRDESPITDIRQLHMWSKISFSDQEINTKHSSILNDSERNKQILENAECGYIDPVVQFDGVIDRICYAGEIKMDRENNVVVNFLSGTFMLGNISSSNPPLETVACVTDFLQGLGATSVKIDITGKTFIDQKMSPSLLDQYVDVAKLKVAIFHSKENALKYGSKMTNLAKLKSGLEVAMRSKYPNAARIAELTQQYEALLQESFGKEEYQSYSERSSFGGKMRKNKTKRKMKRKGGKFGKCKRKSKRNR